MPANCLRIVSRENVKYRVFRGFFAGFDYAACRVHGSSKVTQKCHYLKSAGLDPSIHARCRPAVFRFFGELL